MAKREAQKLAFGSDICASLSALPFAFSAASRGKGNVKTQNPKPKTQN
jgi:hypothetical protein